MLVGAAGFVQALREIRVVHIAGRFGGGKTSMAFMLATIFAERYGYSVVSNVASPIADDWETIVYRPYEGCRAFVIVDEGGLWLQDAASCQAVAAYAAKLDCVFVIPSRVEPPVVLGFVATAGLGTVRGADSVPALSMGCGPWQATESRGFRLVAVVGSARAVLAQRSGFRCRPPGPG